MALHRAPAAATAVETTALGAAAGGTAAGETGEQTAARLDALLADVESLPDPRPQALAHELVRTLMRFYGAGLGRIVAALPPATLRRLADDDLVGGLLALHDLHPDGRVPSAEPPGAGGPPQPEGRRVLPLTVTAGPARARPPAGAGRPASPHPPASTTAPARTTTAPAGAAAHPGARR